MGAKKGNAVEKKPRKRANKSLLEEVLLEEALEEQLSFSSKRTNARRKTRTSN